MSRPREEMLRLAFMIETIFSNMSNEGESMSLVNDEVHYSQENLQIATLEIQSWCKSENISPSLINLVVKLWNESPTGTFPTIDTLVNYFHSISCACMQSYGIPERKALIKHFIINFGRLSTCVETRACMEFYVMNRSTFPNQEEMNTTISRLTQMNASPEAFHDKDKLLVPTLNWEHLKAEDMGDVKGEYCTLCQEELNSEQKCFKLKPCGHMFHCEASKCLGDSCILDWLKNNKHCPVCKSEVKIDKPATGVTPPDPLL